MVQPSTFSAKSLLEFCGRTLEKDAPRLRQIQALMVDFKARAAPSASGLLLCQRAASGVLGDGGRDRAWLLEQTLQ